MAKKKEDIKDDEKMVSVEMTEAEKKEFASFMAKKEDEEVVKDPEPTAFGELRFEHRINNIPYGPGKFEAPRDVAQSLISADHKAFIRRMKEKEGDEYMIDIISRGPGRITKVEKPV